MSCSCCMRQAFGVFEPENPPRENVIQIVTGRGSGLLWRGYEDTDLCTRSSRRFRVASGLAAQTPSLTIQVDHPTAKVSPMLYGLMTEEINYSYDGGHLRRTGARPRGRPRLRRAFALAHGRARKLRRPCFARRDDRPQRRPAAQPQGERDGGHEAAPAGVENDGYWGIPVRPHTTYTGSFYAKTDSAGVPVTVSLVNDQTGVTAATATVTGLTGEWKQYSYTLKTGEFR